MEEQHEQSACESCELGGSRREFLRSSFIAAVGALISLGATEKAAAASVNWISALGRRAGSMSYAIPATDGANIDKQNEVILLRWQSNIYAFSLSCPHQHTALRWEESAARFQCPKHHSKYQPDGTYISGRATRSMDRFAIKREGAAVHVDTTVMYKQPDNPAGWAAAVIRLGDS